MTQSPWGQQVTSLTGTTIGGGAGNDIIGTFNQISAGAAITTANAAAAGVYENSFLEGGGGDDTIVIKGAAVSLWIFRLPPSRVAKATTKFTSQQTVRLKS